MTTVKQLIAQLQDEDPDSPIVYQYLLPEHTDMDEDDFAKVAEHLERTSFYDDLSLKMMGWMNDVKYDLERN